MVYFFFPETKGHTLEEIAEVFDGKKHTPGSADLKLGEDMREEKSLEAHVESVR